MSPRLLRPIASGGFNPRRLANLGGWWDATDSSTYTLDTGVTEWRDKSGLGQAFTQTSGASQPALNSTGINSKPALSFDGSNDWMDLGSGTIGGNNLLAEAANAYSLFIICNSITGSTTLLAKSSATGALRTLQIIPLSGSLSTTIRGTAQNQAAGTFPENTRLMFALSWNGSSMEWRIANTSGTANVGSAAVEAQNVTLGARTASSPAVFFNGLIGEVIFYNRAISATERGSLFRYFNAKWGLSLT
jgi:hypothetical protein